MNKRSLEAMFAKSISVLSEKKSVLIVSISVSILLFYYAKHQFSKPYMFLSLAENIQIFTGLLLVSFSIISVPLSFIDRLGRFFFPDHSTASLKSIFVGLGQFFVLQALGWHLIIEPSAVTYNVFLDGYPLIDGGTIVQTSGTIATLIFAGFQTLTASAENQYEVKGRIRFDRNNGLYLFLRLTIASALGAFWGQKEAYSLALPIAQALLILSIILLIPQISILFKSFSPKSILKTNSDYVVKNIEDFFNLIKSNESHAKSNYSKLNEALAQISVVTWWAYKHRVNLGPEAIRRPFNLVFYQTFEFLKNLEASNPAPSSEAIFEDLTSARQISFVNLTEPELTSLKSDGSPKPRLEFLQDLDLPLRIASDFFTHFKSILIASIEFNGVNYAANSDIVSEFISMAKELKTESWKHALFLTILGELTEGVLRLPAGHKSSIEIGHLWICLIKEAQTSLVSTTSQELESRIIFCEMQFKVAMSNA